MCPNYNACRDARDCFYQDRDGRLTDDGKRMQRQPGYCRFGRRTEAIRRHGFSHVASPMEGIYPERFRDMKKYQI